MDTILVVKFELKHFIFLFLSFIFFTIFGTLSHEFGHYIVAKAKGYSARVSYGYATWEDKKNQPFIDSTYEKYHREIEANRSFPEKKKYGQVLSKQSNDGFWITWGGPIQTMLTGTIGFWLLLLQRRKIVETQRINLYQWLLVFLSLFWLRQLTNLVTYVIAYILNGKGLTNGDEIKLGLFYKIPAEIILVGTAMIAFAILIFVVFRIIPPAKRFTFLVAGFFGGITGYLFWLVYFGPLLMP